ncbi:MAG TPA: anti-sigma-F factor Fin family protein [Pseudogracilibacillus sp.]|nr:anti-sigma-F factor Fin family protein [Pseudogracilibacillus sp.]
MSIVYNCRHCGHMIGKLNQQVVSTSMLGWDKLTPQDKQKMIQYKENGDVHIQAICENCEDSLGQHPDYYELEYFIH